MLVGARFLWIHPDQPWGPTSFPYNEDRVCFLEMKLRGSGTDHPTLQVLWSHIQRAISLLPLCVCLACNGTAICPYSNSLQAYNNNWTRGSEDICSDPRLPDLTPICATFHTNSTQAFNVTQTVCLFYSSTHPSQCHSNCLFILQLHSPLSISSVTVAT